MQFHNVLLFLLDIVGWNIPLTPQEKNFFGVSVKAVSDKFTPASKKIRFTPKSIILSENFSAFG